jgi:PAS domain S-box-containing protein
MPTKPPTSVKSAELREFTTGQTAQPMMHELYRRAEAQLRKRRQKQPSKPVASQSVAEPHRLLHELQVHQIELEMQNTELQTARDRLEGLLEKYTDLYDFAPMGCFSLDEQGHILEVNLTGAALIGVERSQLINRPLQRFADPASRPIFLAFLKRVFSGTGKESCEATLLKEGGTAVWANFHGTLAHSVRDPRKWCRVAISDITSLKQAEGQVRVSEVRYRRLFETAHDGVLLLDPSTRKITDANPFMTQLLGYSHTQLIGKELFEIGLLKDEAASHEMFQKLKRDHQIRYEDLPLESQDGRHQEVEVVANLYRENGHSVIQCNIRDITERKQSEQSLRESEGRYRALFELSPAAVYSCASSGVIQSFNRRAAELWGRKPALGETDEQFCGSYKLFRVDGSFMPHAQCPMAEVLNGKLSEVRDGEVIIERPDRSRITVIVNIKPLKNERREVTGAINCFYDITELRNAEAAQRRLAVLAASNRKLEKEIVRRQAVEETLRKSEQHQILLLRKSGRMQDQLRGLSRQVLSAQEAERRQISRELHDVIAQALTGISVQLEALKKEATLDATSLDCSITRTQRLVQQSVDTVHRFARELRPTVLDDLGLIPALHTYMESFISRTGVRVSLKVFAEVEELDGAQRTALYRVAQEALTNVARHAKANRAEVTIQKLHQAVRMEIKDDGKSFPVESRLNGKGSTRLGLLGMRERSEMVGGNFCVESVPGQGTTIRVEIPLGKPPLRVRKTHALNDCATNH